MRMAIFLVAVLALVAEPFSTYVLARELGTAPDLRGTVWQWRQTLMNNDDEFASNNPAKYTVEFMADGSVVVQADCNPVRGTYTADGNAITIALGPSARAACADDSLGERFTGQLAGAAIYFFRSDDLYVDLKYDSGTMRFGARSRELAGTSWAVIGHNNGRGGVVSSILSTEMTAAFGADGTVSALELCPVVRMKSFDVDQHTHLPAVRLNPITPCEPYHGAGHHHLTADMMARFE